MVLQEKPDEHYLPQQLREGVGTGMVGRTAGDGCLQGQPETQAAAEWLRLRLQHPEGYIPGQPSGQHLL